MPRLSMLIKPASSNCNLNCRYCFYHTIAKTRDIKSYGIMSEETLEEVVKKALAFATGSCTFAFQGGEPTLAGLDFYRKLISFQNKYNEKRVKIDNALQTNGIAIDENWAKFLSENKFLVGLSLDGGKDIHDSNRFFSDGAGSFNNVMRTAELFNRAKVEYNILFVVTAASSRHASQIYGFFKKNRFNYMQFIPCIDPLGVTRGQYEYSLTPPLYLKFLKNLFDIWYSDIKSGQIISIRFFDNILGMFLGQMPEACGMSGICQCQFVIEADGSVYPCDFYVFDKWKIGNIFSDSFPEMKNCEKGQKFVEDSIQLHKDCQKCKWVNFCRGGCKRDREPIGEEASKNYFCQAYKDFFEYSFSRFKELAFIFKV